MAFTFFPVYRDYPLCNGISKRGRRQRCGGADFAGENSGRSERSRGRFHCGSRDILL